MLAFLLLTAFIYMPTETRALSLASPNDLLISISPSSPKAGEGFTANAKSYSFDAERSQIKWFLDGKQVASGVGLAEQTFVATKIGSEMNIRVTATDAYGNFYEATANITIADIDFVVRPLTYTPAFYRGAALPTPGSVVEIFAVPYLSINGIKLKQQNLIYEWSLDDRPVQNQSGGGKNKLALRLADVGSSEYTISLKISSLDNEVSVKKTISLKTKNPEVLFYSSNSLTGIGERALSSFVGHAGDAFSILAEPFFFSLESLRNADISWSANGEKITETVKNKMILDLSSPPNANSQSSFSFSITDNKTIFQRAEASLNIATVQ